jgi:hypothetical protein
VKITIQLSLDYHETLLKYANEASSVYFTLKNGLKITPSHDGGSEVIVILCDEEQAEMLRQAATHFCPEAMPEITRSIKVARLGVS